MIKLLDVEYKIENGNENINEEELKSFFTDYFKDFDYVLGDYAYDKLRLKGFYDSDSSSVKEYNNIKKVDNYIKNYCAYGAKTFLLKKVNK